MPRFALTLRRTGALLAAAAAAGCASTPEPDYAGYDASLAPWRGASEELLRSQWGPPSAETGSGGSRRLTYVTRSASQPTGATIGLGIGGFSFGGSGSVGGGVGVSAPISSSGAVCTTHFQVEQGKVMSWTFEGPGCGARPR
ncbi:MAG: hypothetical protein ACOZJX_13350 [Pseudomonadota bacterium]